jgi:hypothetical protein
MLEIKDLSKLKITKYKQWALHFNYDGNKYLLHYSTGDCTQRTTLWEKIMYDNNSCRLNYISSKFDDCVYDCGTFISNVYSHSDKVGLVKYLARHKFVKSYFDKEIESDDKKVAKLRKRIDYHNDKIWELRNEIAKLKGSW